MLASNQPSFYPKHLWFLITTFCAVILLANWFDPRLVHIFGLDTDAGTIIFPATFLLSDLITEVYGYKHARRAIWTGLFLNVVFILYAQLVVSLPSPNYPNNNALFNQILGFNIRIIIASAISYLCSEPLNSLVMAKLKLRTKGRYMSLRFVSSTVIASGVDSLIFSVLAFYGMMSNAHLIVFILSMWLIKVTIEIFGLPISIYFAKYCKKLEGIDIYDVNTKFNIFSLEANYSSNQNFYQRSKNV